MYVELLSKRVLYLAFIGESINSHLFLTDSEGFTHLFLTDSEGFLSVSSGC